jgi:hypothetical protein
MSDSTLRLLLDDFLDELRDRMSIETMLGTPVIGQTQATFPVLALEFVEADEPTTPRVGQTQRPGVMVTVTLYLFAESEAQLFDLMSDFLTVRKELPQVGEWRIRYGKTQRYGGDESNTYLQFAVGTPVTLTTSN